MRLKKNELAQRALEELTSIRFRSQPSVLHLAMALHFVLHLVASKVEMVGIDSKVCRAPQSRWRCVVLLKIANVSCQADVPAAPCIDSLVEAQLLAMRWLLRDFIIFATLVRPQELPLSHSSRCSRRFCSLLHWRCPRQRSSCRYRRGRWWRLSPWCAACPRPWPTSAPAPSSRP